MRSVLKKEGEKLGGVGEIRKVESQAKPQLVNCGVTEKELAALGTALQLLPGKMPCGVMRMIESSVCIIGLLYGLFSLKLCFLSGRRAQ